MIELYQAEWCPSSQRVRMRLTELGVDFIARQVEALPHDRAAVQEISGQTSIPMLSGAEVASPCVGEAAIVEWIEEHFSNDENTAAHRERAATVGRKQALRAARRDGYAIAATVDASYDDVVAIARDELAVEGFGVLCEIDVKATLKKKIDVDREPYVILGACNPTLANHALQAEPQLGVLLPCNVVVYIEDGSTRVAAIDAARMLSITGNEELAETADEVRERLERVVKRVCDAVATGV